MSRGSNKKILDAVHVCVVEEQAQLVGGKSNHDGTIFNVDNLDKSAWEATIQGIYAAEEKLTEQMAKAVEAAEAKFESGDSKRKFHFCNCKQLGCNCAKRNCECYKNGEECTFEMCGCGLKLTGACGNPVTQFRANACAAREISSHLPALSKAGQVPVDAGHQQHLRSVGTMSSKLKSTSKPSQRSELHSTVATASPVHAPTTRKYSEDEEKNGDVVGTMEAAMTAEGCRDSKRLLEAMKDQALALVKLAMDTNLEYNRRQPHPDLMAEVDVHAPLLVNQKRLALAQNAALSFGHSLTVTSWNDAAVRAELCELLAMMGAPMGKGVGDKPVSLGYMLKQIETMTCAANSTAKGVYDDNIKTKIWPELVKLSSTNKAAKKLVVQGMPTYDSLVAHSREAKRAKGDAKWWKRVKAGIRAGAKACYIDIGKTRLGNKPWTLATSLNNLLAPPDLLEDDDDEQLQHGQDRECKLMTCFPLPRACGAARSTSNGNDLWDTLHSIAGSTNLEDVLFDNEKQHAICHPFNMQAPEGQFCARPKPVWNEETAAAEKRRIDAAASAADKLGPLGEDVLEKDRQDAVLPDNDGPCPGAKLAGWVREPSTWQAGGNAAAAGEQWCGSFTCRTMDCKCPCSDRQPTLAQMEEAARCRPQAGDVNSSPPWDASDVARRDSLAFQAPLGSLFLSIQASGRIGKQLFGAEGWYYPTINQGDATLGPSSFGCAGFSSWSKGNKYLIDVIAEQQPGNTGVEYVWRLWLYEPPKAAVSASRSLVATASPSPAVTKSLEDSSSQAETQGCDEDRSASGGQTGRKRATPSSEGSQPGTKKQAKAQAAPQDMTSKGKMHTKVLKKGTVEDPLQGGHPMDLSERKAGATGGAKAEKAPKLRDRKLCLTATSKESLPNLQTLVWRLPGIPKHGAALAPGAKVHGTRGNVKDQEQSAKETPKISLRQPAQAKLPTPRYVLSPGDSPTIAHMHTAPL
jgi:hypothetical protein